MTLDEIQEKYAFDSARVRSNEEKAKRLGTLRYKTEGSFALSNDPKKYHQFGRLLRFQANAGYDNSKLTALLQEA